MWCISLSLCIAGWTMENDNKRFRHILLFYFDKGNSAHRRLITKYVVCFDSEINPYSKASVSQFCSVDYSFKIRKRSCRLSLNWCDGQIKSIIDANRHSIIRKITEKLDVCDTRKTCYSKCVAYMTLCQTFALQSKLQITPHGNI